MKEEMKIELISLPIEFEWRSISQFGFFDKLLRLDETTTFLVTYFQILNDIRQLIAVQHLTNLYLQQFSRKQSHFDENQVGARFHVIGKLEIINRIVLGGPTFLAILYFSNYYYYEWWVSMIVTSNNWCWWNRFVFKCLIKIEK